jgi:hypothetical protein
MLESMAPAKPKTIAELEAQKKAIKEQAAQEIAAIRKTTAERTAALKSSERRIRAEGKPRQDSRRRRHHPSVPDFRRLGFQVQSPARRVL